jgi:hypothetical protein
MTHLQQFMVMLEAAKVPYDAPIQCVDGTLEVKVYYGIRNFPHFYFDDKSGNLVEVLVGADLLCRSGSFPSGRNQLSYVLQLAPAVHVRAVSGARKS